jgi:hypothetical protein
MKKIMMGLFALVLCGWGICLHGGDKAAPRDYIIRIDQFRNLSEKKSDQACEHILKLHSDIGADLLAQLEQKPSDDAKVYLIYLLGQIREGRATPWLAEHIDFKAPRLDPAWRKRRWGPYPAEEALTKIGELGVREISARLPKDQSELRRKLMITVIWDVQGEKCGRILLEDTLAKQTNDAAKANLKLSLAAFDALGKSLKQK